MTESDDALRVAREEIKRQAAEIEYLKARLEVSAYHPYDGIASRDATIKLQDERIAELREPVNARLLAIAHQTAGIIENTSIETGYCCCGDGMHGHASPMICGHSATDQGAYLAGLLYEDAKAAIAAAEAQQAELSSLSDKAASELQADAARYRYIRTHRIGVKWCKLYAGGPALDEVIDEMMKEQADGEGKG